MGGSINSGKIFGIQFRLHYTWFIIFVLITASLSMQYLPFAYPGWRQTLYWVIGTVISLLFFSSVVAHELAHSLVGRANGIPVKSITLFIFGGVAHMTEEAKRYGAEFRMAVAGPACSLLLGGFFFLVFYLTANLNEQIAAVSFWLAQVNIMLAVFNLIPGFPLDGGRVFRSLMWRFTGDYQRSTRIATRVGQIVGYIFILAGITAAVIRPFGMDWFNGIWLAFIGWFLSTTATSSYRQVKWQASLKNLSASEVMTSEIIPVPGTISVYHLVRDYILTHGNRVFLVAESGEVGGAVSLDEIKNVPETERETVLVRDVMVLAGKLRAVPPQLDALTILERMEAAGINYVLVVSEEKVTGFITRDNLLRILQLRVAGAGKKK